MAPDALPAAIRRLAAREPLDAASVTAAFEVIMRGEGSPARPSAGKLEPSYPMTEPCTPHSP
jgi:hypothetical protein